MLAFFNKIVVQYIFYKALLIMGAFEQQALNSRPQIVTWSSVNLQWQLH